MAQAEKQEMAEWRYHAICILLIFVICCFLQYFGVINFDFLGVTRTAAEIQLQSEPAVEVAPAPVEEAMTKSGTVEAPEL